MRQASEEFFRESFESGKKKQSLKVGFWNTGRKAATTKEV